ncbi:MAG: hypothetical protein JWN64_190 [Parcubacteria group bacterium]|nr:hypothetical protein [Parcubacteria group bacterium]
MAQVRGMIFRARDRKITARFYADLGLSEHEHQHGGPVHHELGPMSDTAVVEIYQASTKFNADVLMIEVDSIEEALKIISTYEITPKTEIMESSDMRFQYVQDPDGRPLMLIKQK